VLQNIRGDGDIECPGPEWELEPVGLTVRCPSSTLRNPDRKSFWLYANNRAEAAIGLGIPASAAPVVENPKLVGSAPRNVSHQIPEQAATAAKPPMTQLHQLHCLVLGWEHSVLNPS
jgi:hypothetical protein